MLVIQVVEEGLPTWLEETSDWREGGTGPVRRAWVRSARLQNFLDVGEMADARWTCLCCCLMSLQPLEAGTAGSWDLPLQAEDDEAEGRRVEWGG
jgi:hypothetical protein